MSEKGPKHDIRFWCPDWDTLTYSEKMEWLQAQINEQLSGESETAQDDDLLAQCMEELNRLTPKLMPPQKHTDRALRKILKKEGTPPRRVIRWRKLLDFALILLVAVMFTGAMIPPSHPIVSADYVYEYEIASNVSEYRIRDIRPDAIDYGQDGVLLERQLADKERNQVSKKPYTVTYWSEEEFLANEDFDIIYPNNMPEEYRIKYITVMYEDELNWRIDFAFYGLLIRWYTVVRTPYAQTTLHKNLAIDEYRVEEYPFYIRESGKTGYYTAFCTTNTLCYSVTTKNRPMIDVVLGAIDPPW